MQGFNSVREFEASPKYNLRKAPKPGDAKIWMADDFDEPYF
jgi:hypothetical protein